MTSKRIVPRSFPTRYIEHFRSSRHNFVRLAPGSNARNLLTVQDDDPNPPFLSEVKEVCAGQEYSSFEITRLIYDKKTDLFCLEAQISFPNPCSEIMMYADVIDTASETVIASFAHSSVFSTTALCYSISEPLPINSAPDHLSVIVYADWRPGSFAVHSAAILEDLEKDEIFTVNHIYPKKEDGYITFSSTTLPDPGHPDLPGLSEPVRDENIQIALYRKPDDRKDLDYLCEFGKDSQGRPLLGVPTLFTITSNGNTSFDVTKPVTATCTISLLGPRAGGKIVTACYHGMSEPLTRAASNDTVITEHVQVSASEKELVVMMTGPWQTPYPKGGNFQIFDFSYEVAVDFYITDGVNSRQYPTQYISSVKGEGACLHHIPHISIRWGCFEEFTLITMADGSLRPIRSMHIGDLVATRNGVSLVDNIWRGYEQKYIRLTVEGHNLKVTDHHPILMADNTWKRAGSLKTGDLILTPQGPAELLDCAVIQEGIHVYNLSFSGESDVVLIAGEVFYAGDFGVQNSSLNGEL